MVQSTNAVFQQDELHYVADLLKVHLSDQHVDGVGGGEDDGEEEEADGVTSHRVPALAAWGGEATTPDSYEQKGDRDRSKCKGEEEDDKDRSSA